MPEQNIQAEFPENYLSILDAGFSSANAESDAPFCTHCGDLSPIGEKEGNGLVDHIFVRNAETSDLRRILDEPFTFTLLDEDIIRLTPSDHFGSAAVVEFF